MFVRTDTIVESSSAPLYLLFFENALLVDSEEAIAHLSAEDVANITPNQHFFLGMNNDTPVYAVVADTEESAPEGTSFIALRTLYKSYDDNTFAMTSLASQVCRWDREHRFCGSCGTATETLDYEFGKKCPSCGSLHYPTISPAIIVAIKKGNQVLLAQNYKWVESGLFSTLAGFVEPAETIEHAVGREVMEEVGVSVKNIEYVASQSWPFPGSLMLGFVAEYESGDLTPDGEEIIAAGWYDLGTLPEVIPNKKAIARSLIEAVLGPIDRE